MTDVPRVNTDRDQGMITFLGVLVTYECLFQGLSNLAAAIILQATEVIRLQSALTRQHVAEIARNLNLDLHSR